MGFPRSVRDSALVAAARRCCVCHRYGGVGIEVHHIVPEAQGGPNTLDNAIALCFDCHAAAGHYNDSHPRGTKFSPSELRLHREKWHQQVRDQRIESPTEDVVRAVYLTCRSDEAFQAVLQGELQLLPSVGAGRSHLWTGPIGSFLDALPQASGYLDVGYYSDPEDFKRLHPETAIDVTQAPLSGGVIAQRHIPDRELLDLAQKQNPLLFALLSAGYPSNELVSPSWVRRQGGCGLGTEEWESLGYQESATCRQSKAVFLSIINTHSTAVRLIGLEVSRVVSPGWNYRPWKSQSGVDTTLLPPWPVLEPGDSVIIPIACLLPPFDGGGGTLWRSTVTRDGIGFDEVSCEPLSSNDALRLIGPELQPKSVTLMTENGLLQQPIHAFDPGRTYKINRYWACGSCPHVFFANESSQVSYAGELFTASPGAVCEEHFTVPATSKRMIIAELEAETTRIEFLKINGRVVLRDRLLKTGEQLEVTCQPGDVVTIKGSYTPESEHAPELPQEQKLQLLRRFIAASAYE
ncbi:HNH endonuclease [Corallococcus exercitus]|uniref:HNH endonuclease n=1 Tax=Corallococcus exercitus TaxID=2316736 RepID=UPI0035D4714B